MLFLGVGAVLWRRQYYDPVPQVVGGRGLFDLGTAPLALSRPDTPHIRPVALVPLSLLPALALFVIRRRRAAADYALRSPPVRSPPAVSRRRLRRLHARPSS